MRKTALPTADPSKSHQTSFLLSSCWGWGCVLLLRVPLRLRLLRSSNLLLLRACFWPRLVVRDIRDLLLVGDSCVGSCCCRRDVTSQKQISKNQKDQNK